MKIMINKWWKKKDKNLMVVNYKEDWSRNGIKRTFKISDNRAKRRRGARHYNLEIYIGYIVIRYTNFNLQK